jgi:hypothetical protein
VRGLRHREHLGELEAWLARAASRPREPVQQVGTGQPRFGPEQALRSTAAGAPAATTWAPGPGSLD